MSYLEKILTHIFGEISPGLFTPTGSGEKVK